MFGVPLFDGRTSSLTQSIGGGGSFPPAIVAAELTLDLDVAVFPDGSDLAWTAGNQVHVIVGDLGGSFDELSIIDILGSYDPDLQVAKLVAAEFETGQLRAIALDNAHVYVVDDVGIARVPKAGGVVERVVTEDGRITGLALDEARMYWTVATDGRVMVADKPPAP